MKKLILAVAAMLLFLSHYGYAVGALYIREYHTTQTFTLMTMRTYDASCQIENQVATTTVDQVFHNDATQYSQVEATYVFPLPPGAVITQLVYWFNGQSYVANIREKAAAQAAYDATIRRNLDPALLQYFGENTFKLSIAPIQRNSDVRFSITYTELLPYNFNVTTYNFLLSTTGLSPKPLERVSLKILLSTTSDLTSVSSPSHGNTAENQITKVSDRQYSISYGDENFSPDRNYRLEFEYKRDSINLNVLCYRPTPDDSIGTDGFFATWVIPSDDLNKSSLPRSVVFCADVSSSMEGKRIEQLRTALQTFVSNLHQADYFNILLFSTNVVRFQPDLVQATPDNVALAQDYIKKNVNAAGLTNIDEALQACFSQTFQSGTTKSICFLTDGMQSWGELDSNMIIAHVAQHKDSEVHLVAFGIGNEPSHFLLNNISSSTGGYAVYIADDDSIATIVSDHFERMAKAVLTNLDLQYGTLDYYDVFPKHLPDLYYGAQVLQLGRYPTGGGYPVSLSGNVQDQPFNQSSWAYFPAGQGGNRSVSRLWASAKINSLLALIDSVGERKELVDAVIDLSLRFQILTRYTALYSDPNTDKASEVAETAGTAINGSVVPNPASESVQIRLNLDMNLQAQVLHIDVYSELGEYVATIHTGISPSGEQVFAWNLCDAGGRRVAPGIYYIRVRYAQQMLTLPFSIIH